MEYMSLTDVELVNLFLSCKERRASIRDELFARYYEQFDRRIRAVLYTNGLPYSPSEFYYNEIFTDIYSHVFDIENLENLLGKYRAEKGVFSIWFLNFVVVNKIKNWLGKINKASGRKNIEFLRKNSNEMSMHVPFDEPAGRCGVGLSLSETLPRKQEVCETVFFDPISDAISNLSPAKRLILRLLFLAYQEVPEIDLTYMANELDVSVSSLREELADLCMDLRASPRYESSERIELALECLSQQENSLRGKLKRIDTEIDIIFPEREMVDDGVDLLFKDIEARKRELEGLYRCKKLGADKYRFSYLLLEKQYASKQLSKVSAKRLALIKEYNSGKHFLLSSYRQLAKLLDVSEGTVASRISRTLHHLKELLEENEGKTCITRVDEVPRRKSGYAG